MPKFHLRQTDFTYQCCCGYERSCNDKKILVSVSKRHRQFCEIENQAVAEAKANGINVAFNRIDGHTHQKLKFHK